MEDEIYPVLQNEMYQADYEARLTAHYDKD